MLIKRVISLEMGSQEIEDCVLAIGRSIALSGNDKLLLLVSCELSLSRRLLLSVIPVSIKIANTVNIELVKTIVLSICLSVGHIKKYNDS